MAQTIKDRTATEGASSKSTEPRKSGDAVRKAQEWGGGSKGSKGPVTEEDRANDQSSARS
jgi:hypothetical protein